MRCYRIHVPVGGKVAGVTADGQPTTVLPGEYVVHVLRPKAHVGEPLVRFVGADPMCRDVHVPLKAAIEYIARGANDVVVLESAAAA